MARNVRREDFLVGRPPEMRRGDMETEGYLHGARAELWRELRDQPLTLGGYCLSALWDGEAVGMKTPRMRLCLTYLASGLQAGQVHGLDSCPLPLQSSLRR